MKKHQHQTVLEFWEAFYGAHIWHGSQSVRNLGGADWWDKFVKNKEDVQR